MAKRELVLSHGEREIIIANDYTYTSGSSDNARIYDVECVWSRHSSSRYSVIVQEGGCVLRSCILVAGGGVSGIHEHSALLHGSFCLIAIGPYLCSLSIPSLELTWKVEVDEGTCFGVYYSAHHDCLVSHGELAIARVTHGGKLVWQSGGKDIFTNGFRLCGDYVEAVDFNDEIYHIDIDSGVSRLYQP